MDNIPQDTDLISRLKRRLIEICTAHRCLNRQFYDIEELQEKWKQSAPQYMADVVPEYARYPMVAVAWACYYGMAAATYWDSCWDSVKDTPDLYAAIRDRRGFDNMDDFVLDDVIGLHAQSADTREAAEATRLVTAIQDCAAEALSLLAHSAVEPGTKEAFYIFSKVAREFFTLGVSITLYRLGYKYERMDLN